MTDVGGIVVYVKDCNGLVHFLLGYETSISKWSGFVGGYEESDGTIECTAIREFNEETAKVFENDLPFVKDKIKDSLLITGITGNRIVYLWFIQFPYNIINENVEQRFLDNLIIMTDKCYKEKSKLKWFNINEICKNDILYKLKKVILDNYSKF